MRLSPPLLSFDAARGVGLESPGLALTLLPCEALALMDKIVLGDDLLAKMGVDAKDEAMVTGVKFMMVDTGMDEETVQMVSKGAFCNRVVNAFLVSSFQPVFISKNKCNHGRLMDATKYV